VLVLGAAFANTALARRILKAWLDTGFLGGRHKRRLLKIKAIEKISVKEGLGCQIS